MCTSCNTEVKKTYWQRSYPNAVLCHGCWLQPPDDLAAQASRDSIASILWQTRQLDRGVAARTRDSLKGMGVPTNRRRGDPRV